MMFCPNCGKELEGTEKFCSGCGFTLQKNEKKRVCLLCEYELGDDEQFCPMCGTPFQGQRRFSTAQPKSKPKNTPTESGSSNAVYNYFFEYKRSLPAFIIGLIGSILGMFGGVCTTMCSCGIGSDSAFLYIFGGAVLGLIGSCLCLNKAKIGSALQLIGVLMMIIRAYSRGAEIFTIFGMVLLLTASVIGLISAYLLDFLKKK